MSDQPAPKTLAQASHAFFTALESGKPVTCPCCQRKTQVYTRTLHHEMAVNLVRLVRAHERTGGWCSVREFVQGSSKATKASTDAAFLVHWQLVECEKRGMYRPTQAGIDFVHGRATAPASVQTYDNQCVGRSERRVSIRDVLGSDLDALLA